MPVKRKPHSGPNISRDRRKAVGRPSIELSLSEQCLKQIDALIANGYSPKRDGRSGVVRRAIEQIYAERYGDADPDEVLREK